MPIMGIPTQLNQINAFNDIKIAEKNHQEKGSSEQDTKKQIIDKINGNAVGKGHLYKDNTKMGKDEFLRLLTFQLQNQDPTKPTDQQKFAGELAQFSQLEQLSNIRTLLEKKESNNLYENKIYAAGLLGKKILTQGQTLDYKGEGQGTKLYFNLNQDAEKTQIRIFDKKHNLVFQTEKENLKRGPQTFLWEGQTLDGAGSGKGEYSFDIKSWDQNLQPIKSDTRISGIITGINFDNGETILVVNDRKVALRDVDSFENPREGNERPTLPEPVVQLKEDSPQTLD